MPKVNKRTGAIEQLDAAIYLFFQGDRQIAVRTLAGASVGVLSDLVEKQTPGHSWRTYMIEDSGMTRGAAFAVLNKAQNFLKHADNDPDAILEFDEKENDDLIFVGTIEAGTLDLALTYRMQAFQLWYFAVYGDQFTGHHEIIEKGRALFPGILHQSRLNQLALGEEFARKAREILTGGSSPSPGI